MRDEQAYEGLDEGDERRVSGERPAGAMSGCHLEPRGHFYEVGERVGFHLLHHLAAVRLYRDLANAEFAADLLIQQAGDHQGHDLPFARGEGRVTVPERLHLRLVTKSNAAAFEGMSDGGQ